MRTAGANSPPPWPPPFPPPPAATSSGVCSDTPSLLFVAGTRSPLFAIPLRLEACQGGWRCAVKDDRNAPLLLQVTERTCLPACSIFYAMPLAWPLH